MSYAPLAGRNRFGSIRFRSVICEKNRFASLRFGMLIFPVRRGSAFAFSCASWLGAVRFCSVPRSVLAGSEIIRFGSISYSFIHIYIYIYMYVHTHMYTDTYLSLSLYIYIYIYICKTHIYIYIYIYYNYTYIDMASRSVAGLIRRPSVCCSCCIVQYYTIPCYTILYHILLCHITISLNTHTYIYIYIYIYMLWALKGIPAETPRVHPHDLVIRFSDPDR